MNEPHLHIISLDVPWPANYGGAIDIFYKAKALAEAGVKVHLHCFEYGRGKADEQLSFCHQVHYYKRDTRFIKQLSTIPYIVSSRRSEALVQDLLQDDYPILCEGLHTTAILSDKRLADRAIFVRTHNVEHDYYRMLGQSEQCGWRKMYYHVEAAKLRSYEAVLECAQALFAISQKDADYFSKHFDNVHLLPAFAATNAVTALPGKGDYVLYHGNLSVRENVEAALWLMRNVFSKLEMTCIVAGLHPVAELLQEAQRYDNVQVLANLEEEEMQKLLQNAHINVMVTNQPTGLKLKLLNALYQGRFCLVNDKMLAGTALNSLCVVENDAEAMVTAIQRLQNVEFTQEDIRLRQQTLAQLYNNEANARELISAISR